MIAHDHTEASSSPIITILTTMCACRNSSRNECAPPVDAIVCFTTSVGFMVFPSLACWIGGHGRNGLASQHHAGHTSSCHTSLPTTPHRTASCLIL